METEYLLVQALVIKMGDWKERAYREYKIDDTNSFYDVVEEDGDYQCYHNYLKLARLPTFSSFSWLLFFFSHSF